MERRPSYAEMIIARDWVPAAGPAPLPQLQTSPRDLSGGQTWLLALLEPPHPQLWGHVVGGDVLFAHSEPWLATDDDVVVPLGLGGDAMALCVSTIWSIDVTKVAWLRRLDLPERRAFPIPFVERILRTTAGLARARAVGLDELPSGELVTRWRLDYERKPEHFFTGAPLLAPEDDPRAPILATWRHAYAAAFRPFSTVEFSRSRRERVRKRKSQ